MSIEKPNWKQEVAEAVTPIEDVNNASAILIWNISVGYDPDSPLPQSPEGIVNIRRSVSVKGAKEVNAALVDGKNFVAGDYQTEIAYLTYLKARKPQTSDPVIADNGIVHTLDEMRPLTSDYGFDLGIDTLQIGSDVWQIVRADAVDLMNDGTGNPEPAKLRLTLRK